MSKKELYKPYTGYNSLSENASVGGTSSGSVATVNMPLGGTVRRADGGGLLSGTSSAEEFPNTPEHIRKQAAQWKSANKNDK